MGRTFGWDKYAEEQKSTEGRTEFLRLESGKQYNLRLVLDPYGYDQHWEPFPARSPGEGDPLIAMGHHPKLRFSCWVLDRDNGNQLKVMDFPPSLGKSFAAWSTRNGGKNPGGNDGPNFRVVVDGRGKATRYSAVDISPAPFTQDEIEMFKCLGGSEGLIKKLSELRKDDTIEEITIKLQKLGYKVPVPSAAVVKQTDTIINDREIKF